MNNKNYVLTPDLISETKRSREAAFQKMTEELEKARTELDMLAQTVAGGVARLAIDDNLRIVTATEGYYRMTGYTEEESVEPPFSGRGLNLVLPQDLPIVKEAVEKLLHSNGPCRTSYRIRKKDGSIAWNTAYCARVEQHQGERCVDVFFSDITEHRQTEIEFESLLNHLPVGVVRALNRGMIQILYANDEFYRQIGYSPEEFAGEPFQNDYLRIVLDVEREGLIEWSKLCAESGQEFPSIDYRILTKGGCVRWMRAKTARLNDISEPWPIMQGIITDITEERLQRQAVAHNEERFRIISEQTRDTVFEWDIQGDTVQFSPAYEKMFGFKPSENVSVKRLTQYDIIYEEDKPQVEHMIQEILDGAPYAETQYRAKCADGTYIWCRNRVTTLYDDEHCPIRAIGILTDIDSYMRTTSTLQEQAMQDSMTGLLNRMAFQIQVEQILQDSPDLFHAFLLFDVDRFKQINDTLGHLAGDQTLQALAALLPEQFRESDLIGRMGGDEFAVFLTNIPNREIAAHHAKRLVDMVCLCPVSALQDKTVPFTVSIGTALYPTDGRTFLDLYMHADQALYEAKRRGGNGWA